jgi:hypothetical protein
MKVKCINIYNEHTKKYQDHSAQLTIGKEYIVLEVMICTEEGLAYRLVGDNENKMPAIYEALQFEITSDLIPANWSTTIIDKSLIVLGPKVWHENEFWIDCYDHEPGAIEIYKREAAIIYEEENSF